MGCKENKIYFAEYNAISISPLKKNVKHDLSIWESVDTTNIFSNNFIVVNENVKCYSNEHFSFFNSIIINSNIELDKKKPITEEILLNKKTRIIYFINEKVAYRCARNKINFNKIILTDSTYVININSGDNNAIIKLNSNVPKSLSSKILSKKIPNGVSEIISSRQKIQLLNYSEQNYRFDFNAVLLKAKKVCVLNKKEINLIFPQ
jgi:hypothetical protein